MKYKSNKYGVFIQCAVFLCKIYLVLTLMEFHKNKLKKIIFITQKFTLQNLHLQSLLNIQFNFNVQNIIIKIICDAYFYDINSSWKNVKKFIVQLKIHESNLAFNWTFLCRFWEFIAKLINESFNQSIIFCFAVNKRTPKA